MDFFSSNFKELALYIIDPNQRLFWGYLLSALIFATIVYFINLKNGYKPDSTEEKPRGLIGFLIPRKVFLARSALNDYTLLIANKLFKAALFPFIVLTMVPVALGSSSAIEWVFGPMTPFAWSSTSIMVIFTLMLFIFDDFRKFR